MKANEKYRLIPLLGIILSLVACELPVFITSSTVTPLPGSVGTSIVQTAAVAQSQTALFLPPPSHTPTHTSTETLLPTNTSTETPTPTETIVFIFPTSTLTRTVAPTDDGLSDADENLACRLISRNPANNQVFDPKIDFDARWVVENKSGNTWDSNNVDYVYLSGTKMHQKPAYDLSQNVVPGESVTIIVDMVAPKNVGTYSTTWILRSSQTEFCRFSISIVVK